MHEHQQREETVVDRSAVQEIARDRLGKNRQPVEPLGGHHRDILGETVPHQPVAADARGVQEPQQDHAGQPRIPAHAAVTVQHELARQMQQHGDHHRIRGVAVQAARHAARVPLGVRQVFDRAISAVDAGLEKNVNIDTARGNHPEKEKRQRPEVIERIDPRAKGRIEGMLEKRKCPAARALYRLNQNGSPQKTATGDGYNLAFFQGERI